MRTADKMLKLTQSPGKRRSRKKFLRSLEETAARAAVTATVTFAVGWMLKKMFEKSVAQAAEEGARSGAKRHHSTTAPA